MISLSSTMMQHNIGIHIVQVEVLMMVVMMMMIAVMVVLFFGAVKHGGKHGG